MALECTKMKTFKSRYFQGLTRHRFNFDGRSSVTDQRKLWLLNPLDNTNQPVYEMDDSELFDIFDVDNNPEPAQKTIAAPVERSKSHKSKSKKDKHDSNGVSNGKRAHNEADESRTEDRTLVKKARKNVEDPIVVDSFETESDQIVPATSGLQGTVPPADANIVIKKRVSPLPSPPPVPNSSPHWSHCQGNFKELVTDVLVPSRGCVSCGRLEIYSSRKSSICRSTSKSVSL